MSFSDTFSYGFITINKNHIRKRRVNNMWEKTWVTGNMSRRTRVQFPNIRQPSSRTNARKRKRSKNIKFGFSNDYFILSHEKVDWREPYEDREGGWNDSLRKSLLVWCSMSLNQKEWQIQMEEHEFLVETC